MADDTYDADGDKYPVESDRRRFVKGVVGSSALVATGGVGSVIIDSTTSAAGAGGGTTIARAIENTAGPAPRGMPQIPIEIDDEGYIKGVFPEYEEVTVRGRTVQEAKTEIGGYEYGAQWFQYCGVQSYAGLQPGADQDNYFRYSSSGFDWHGDLGGDRVNVADFEEVGDGYEEWGNGVGDPGIGKPASATWRSQDVSGKDTMPVQIIRSTKIEEMVEQASGEEAEWLEASTDQGTIAWLNKCTHFCCVPGFKAEGSAKFNGENDVYCPCHQSVYDPFSNVQTTFTALPRPSDD